MMFLTDFHMEKQRNYQENVANITDFKNIERKRESKRKRPMEQSWKKLIS